MTRDRGQLVLLAAVALAVTLVPLALAYLQLGYASDVTAGATTGTAGDTTRPLQRAFAEAADGVPSSHAWDRRDAAVGTVRDRLAPTLRTLNRSRLGRDTVTTVRYNRTRAGRWARTACPGGPGRAFGPCEASRGLVVQERAGRTHVVALAVDITVVGGTRSWTATAVLRPVRS